MGLKIALCGIFRKIPRPQGQREWLMDETNHLWEAAYMAAVYETDDSLMDGRIQKREPRSNSGS